MAIYIIVSIVLLLDIINPRILWYIDFWKHNGDKPEPSGTYILLNRIFAFIGLVVLWSVYFTRLGCEIQCRINFYCDNRF